MAVIFSHGVVEIAVVIVVEIALMRMEIVVKIVKIVVEMMVKIEIVEIVVVIVEIYWWRFCEEVDSGIIYSENRMVIVKEIVVKWW